MRLFSLFSLALLSLFCLSSAKLRQSTASIIPTADLLCNKQFDLKLNLNLFSYQHPDDSSKTSWWYLPVGGLDFGVADRVEAGAGYAGGPYLQFKALLLNEDKFAYAPAIAIGARDILSSREAFFFGMENKDTVDALTNTAYLAFSKNIPPLNSRLHIGAMSDFRLKSERVTAFAGVEIYIGGGAYLTYEGFQRFNDFHQFFSINVKFGTTFAAGVGLSELTYMLRQNGKTGFFTKGEGNTSGYGAPGFNVALAYFNSFTGGSEEGFKGLEDELQETQKTIADMRVRDKELALKLETNEKHLQELDEDLALYTSRATSKAKQDYRLVIDEHLNAITNLLESKYAYDPEVVSDHTKKIIEYKDLALPKLSDIVRNPKADPKLASLAIQMVGEIGDKRSKQILIRLLDYKDSGIKIEAIIALGKLRDKTVIADIQRSLSDTDEAVVMAAQEVLFSLTGERPAGAADGKKSVKAPGDTTVSPAPVPADSGVSKGQPKTKPSASPASAPDSLKAKPAPVVPPFPAAAPAKNQ